MSRILKDLQSKGFTGSRSALYRHIRVSPAYNLQRIAGLFEHYHPGDCILTLDDCFTYNCFAPNFVQGFITYIVTCNKAFEEWGEIFNNDVVAAAIWDRLLHHSCPFLIQGKSYRMKEITGGKTA